MNADNQYMMMFGATRRNLTIFSYGGGQDSFAILLKLIHDFDFRHKYAPEHLLVVMSDTGAEHQKTYLHISSDVKRLCKQHGIEFHLLRPEDGFHSDSWQTLYHQYEKNSTIGSAAFPQSCTDNLKVKVVDRFLSSWISKKTRVADIHKNPIKQWVKWNNPIKLLLGFGADEPKRGASSHDPVWKQQCVERIYPLMDLGFTRGDCQKYIASWGESVPPPSNCKICFYMSLQELLWLYRNDPDEFERWVSLENAKILKNGGVLGGLTPKGKANLGVYGKRGLRERLELAQEKYGHLTDTELNNYKQSHGHCVKSTY